MSSHENCDCWQRWFRQDDPRRHASSSVRPACFLGPGNRWRSKSKPGDGHGIVTEPYYRSLETTGRLALLARDIGIKRLCVVANKVGGARDEEAIRRYCAEHELEVLAVLPFDEAVVEAEQAGTPILDADPESAYVKTVEQLLEKLPTVLSTVS